MYWTAGELRGLGARELKRAPQSCGSTIVPSTLTWAVVVKVPASFCRDQMHCLCGSLEVISASEKKPYDFKNGFVLIKMKVLKPH